jgi:uncharacterized RDD family membrane protein YckC
MSPPPQAASVEAKSAPAKFDSDEDENEPVPGSEAAFETRVIAGILDVFIAGGISWVVGIISSKLGVLAGCGYLAVRDALPFLEGHSVGKRIMKIKAVTLEGKSLSGDWQSSIVRNLLIAIPPFGLLEAYILYSRKEKGGSLRRLGDEWAKTKVVAAKEPSAF